MAQVVEHDDGLLGEYDELDMLATDDTVRGQLSTTGSSLNTAVIMEAALSSAVMHENVVETYDYQTHASAASGGQVTLHVTHSCLIGGFFGFLLAKLLAMAQPIYMSKVALSNHVWFGWP